MKEKIIQQYIRLEDCHDRCSICPVLNKAQREIGNNGITNKLEMLAIALNWEIRKCPLGKNMNPDLLHPARQRTNKRQSII